MAETAKEETKTPKADDPALVVGELRSFGPEPGKPYNVRNVSDGPRGFDTVADGDVMLDPKRSQKVTLTDAEAARLDRFGYFKITAAK